LPKDRGSPKFLPRINAVQNLYHATVDGLAWRAILRSSGWPTILILIFGLIWGVKRRLSLLPFYSLLIFGYGLFFSLGPALRGVGRYQVEYVAPCLAAAILLFAIECGARWKPRFIAAAVLFVLNSWFANYSINQDIRYGWWADRRISTESIYPYEQALGFLQRLESHGKFIVLGGVPTYGNLLLWLRGFTLEDGNRYRKRMDAFEAWVKPDQTLEEFEAFLKSADIDHVVVQCGDRNERQHRFPAMANAIRNLQTSSDSPIHSYARRWSFVGSYEGALEVYSKKSLTY
jgi:hypothetical protein